MNNKVQHLEKIQQKVKDDLHLLGVQVKDVAKKNKGQQMFQQQQGMASTITAEDQ